MLAAPRGDQIVHFDDIRAIGRHSKVDERINTEVAPVHRQPLSLSVENLEHRAQPRVDAFGPALDDDPLSLFRVKPEMIEVFPFFDPPIDYRIQENRLRLSQ